MNTGRRGDQCRQSGGGGGGQRGLLGSRRPATGVSRQAETCESLRRGNRKTRWARAGEALRRSICLIVASVSGVPDAPDTRRDATERPRNAEIGRTRESRVDRAFKGFGSARQQGNQQGGLVLELGARRAKLVPFRETGDRTRFAGLRVRQLPAGSQDHDRPKYISRDDPPRVFPGETNFGSVPTIAAKEDAPSLPKKATKRGQD